MQDDPTVSAATGNSKKISNRTDVELGTESAATTNQHQFVEVPPGWLQEERDKLKSPMVAYNPTAHGGQFCATTDVHVANT